MESEIIESITTQIIDLPTKRVHNFSSISITTKAYVLVRVYTKSGLMGIGEATTPGGPWWAGEAVETIRMMIDEYLAPALVGENALDTNRLLAKMDKVAVLNTFAKAAIEMALLDTKGKALGVPLYALLGGLYRDSSRISWALAIGDPTKDIEEAERIMAGNIAQNFKVKMGYKTPEDDVDYIGKLCKDLCGHATVRGDLNAAWTESQAKRLIPELADHGMSLIEQPVQAWNRAGMARVKSAVNIPILADESVRTLQDGLEVVNFCSADSISLKPMKSGGIVACQQLSAIAAAAGVPCYAGTFLETSIGTASAMHLVASTPNVDFGNELIGPIWLADDIVENPIEYRDNQVFVKHGPGLGVSLDEKKVRHYLRK